MIFMSNCSKLNAGRKIGPHFNWKQVLNLSNVTTGKAVPKVVNCPKIASGEIITDRKNKFQPHLATVQSVDEVKMVLKKLYEDKKIASAFHNMYAYRIAPKDSTSLYEDYKDDGEAYAGSRILRLLQVIGAKNVVVIVTRWYGGIQLGPDRFRHISNAARQILDSCGYIKYMEKNCTKRRKK